MDPHTKNTKVLVIDNYDSFTYNLVHYLEDLNASVTVWRNNQLHLEAIDAFNHIVLSPGPGVPDEAGLLKAIIRRYAPYKNILGICLGHQAIAEVFGGSLINLKHVFHGVSSKVTTCVDDEYLFNNLPNSFEVGRYHSWAVNPYLPEVLETTSIDEHGQIMSLRHKFYNVSSLQFHPESVLTPKGKTILGNWLAHCINKDTLIKSAMEHKML